MRYRIKVYRKSIKSLTFNVESDDPELAREQAVKKAENSDYDLDGHEVNYDYEVVETKEVGG